MLRSTHKSIAKLLSGDVDFTKDERFPLDFDKNALTADELTERWRLRVKFELLVERASSENPQHAVEFLKSRYEALRIQKMALDEESLYQIYANSLAALYDPHTHYLSRSEMGLFRRTIARRSFTLGFELRPDHGDYQITKVSPNFVRHHPCRPQERDRLAAARSTRKWTHLSPHGDAPCGCQIADHSVGRRVGCDSRGHLGTLPPAQTQKSLREMAAGHAAVNCLPQWTAP
ncbi:MAG: hypothetical protein KDB14_19510 [Planctomycetales bacterium]|nr:hypothetical protein [Planctomycetales bacterium]